MISILLTAWREERTVGKAITSFVGTYTGDYEVIVGCPDEETWAAAYAAAQVAGIESKLTRFRDAGVGKPAALRSMMDMAKGDVWFFGDGDVYYGENVIPIMLQSFQDTQVQAVSGRPVSADEKDTIMGYFGHLLSDAAHHKRTIDLTDNPGKSRSIVKKRPFFPVSGYLFAMRASDIRPHPHTLVEDAYISYMINQRGGKIAYAPNALVFVNYPRNLADYFKQKKRSVGGYVQLWEYGFVNPGNNTRSFGRELEYFWFPIRYAQSLTQLLWSLLLYPLRIWLWIQIFWERRIRRKGFAQTWVRIETTK